MATKKSKAPKSEAPAAAPTTSGRVSHSDQGALGVQDLSGEDLEAAKDFYATSRGTAITARDNSVYAGNSAPRSWEQVYRENASDIDIRAGVKPDQPEEESE